VACSPNPVTYGGSSTCTPTAATGYTFGTFSGDCSGSTCSLTNVTSAKSVTASFAPAAINRAMTGATNNASFGTVSCPSTVLDGATATCTGTASGGYQLGSAAGSSTLCGTVSVSGNTITAGPVTGACTVTGTFGAIPPSTYAITATASPTAGGSVACSPSPVTSGGSSTCTPTAATGYTFSSFSGDCSGATCTLTNVTSAKSVTGTFVQNSYAITTTASPTAGGTVACTPSSVTYGNSSTCTGSANPGYTFSTFSGDCTGPTCVLTNITAAKSVTANFTANPVNGACGGAAGLPSAIVPNANLCATGSTPGLVSAAGGGYSWSCAGTGSGAQPAQCTAPGATVSGSTARTTFELISGSGCVVRLAGVQAPPAGGPGNNVQMPYGVLDFTLEECTAGMARVRMTYSASIEGMQFYKFVNANWVQLTTVSALNVSRDGEVVISGNTATFNIRDNGAYDADSTPGVIVDPGGPGYAPVAAATPQSIPTLSEWGMMFLSSLVAMFGMAQMRRRRADR
jgi:hypothetical protein